MDSIEDDTLWSEIKEFCPCLGEGWSSTKDSYTECPVHYNGQLHPESVLLLLDDPFKLEEEQRKSSLRWNVSQAKLKKLSLLKEIQVLDLNIIKWELEIINKTPTLKMPAMAALPKEGW